MVIATDLGVARCDDIRKATVTWEAINTGLSAGANRDVYGLRIVRQADEGVILTQGGVFVTSGLTLGTPSWSSILTLAQARTLVGDGSAVFCQGQGFANYDSTAPGPVLSWYLDPGYVGVWMVNTTTDIYYYLHTHNYGDDGWVGVDVVTALGWAGAIQVAASHYSWNVNRLQCVISNSAGGGLGQYTYVYSVDYGHAWATSGVVYTGQVGYAGHFMVPPLDANGNWNTDDNLIYATRGNATTGAVRRTTTGWATANWASIGDAGMVSIFAPRLVGNPHDPDYMVFAEDSAGGATEDVWTTPDGGSNWTNEIQLADNFPVQRMSRNPWGILEWVITIDRQVGVAAPYNCVYYSNDFLVTISNKTGNLFIQLGNFVEIRDIRSFWGHYES